MQRLTRFGARCAFRDHLQKLNPHLYHKLTNTADSAMGDAHPWDEYMKDVRLYILSFVDSKTMASFAVCSKQCNKDATNAHITMIVRYGLLYEATQIDPIHFTKQLLCSNNKLDICERSIKWLIANGSAEIFELLLDRVLTKQRLSQKTYQSIIRQNQLSSIVLPAAARLQKWQHWRCENYA